jgi:hypothetical protein
MGSGLLKDTLKISHIYGHLNLLLGDSFGETLPNSVSTDHTPRLHRAKYSATTSRPINNRFPWGRRTTNDLAHFIPVEMNAYIIGGRCESLDLAFRVIVPLVLVFSHPL